MVEVWHENELWVQSENMVSRNGIVEVSVWEVNHTIGSEEKK